MPVLILLLVRELSKRLAHTPLISVCVNPGYCVSALRRNLPAGSQRAARLMEIVVGRSTEEGSRMLVWAAVGDHGHEDELRGAYVNLCKVDEPSEFAVSKVGQEVQARVWVCGTILRLRILSLITRVNLQAESVEALSSVSPSFKEVITQIEA